MRARLVYQSRKRGTLESDLLLSTFAQERLGGMGERELREYDKVSGKGRVEFYSVLFTHVRIFFRCVALFFLLSPTPHARCVYDTVLTSRREQLLDEPDWDIYYWATGKKTPPERWVGSNVLEQLREHVKNEGKVVRRMPDLS